MLLGYLLFHTNKVQVSRNFQTVTLSREQYVCAEIVKLLVIESHNLDI